jgi:preprotein translocase subunit SecE
MSKSVSVVKQDNRLVRYLKETRAEMRKVHWPTRREARQLTLIVVAVTVVMTLILGVIEFILSWLAEGVFISGDAFRSILLIVLSIAGLVVLFIMLRRQ